MEEKNEQKMLIFLSIFCHQKHTKMCSYRFTFLRLYMLPKYLELCTSQDEYDKIPVEKSGNGLNESVKEILRFSEAKLSEELFDNIQRCG